MSGWISRNRHTVEAVKVCALVVNGEITPEQGVHLLCVATYTKERGQTAHRFFWLGVLVTALVALVSLAVFCR